MSIHANPCGAPAPQTDRRAEQAGVRREARRSALRYSAPTALRYTGAVVRKDICAILPASTVAGLASLNGGQSIAFLFGTVCRQTRKLIGRRGRSRRCVRHLWRRRVSGIQQPCVTRLSDAILNELWKGRGILSDRYLRIVRI